MKNIEIHNFRCFRHLAVDFTSGINLFIGDNASGKTSLLLACKYANACFFSGFSDIYTSWISPRVNDFSRIDIGEKRMNTQSIRIDFSFNDGEMPGAEFYGLYDRFQSLFCKNEKTRKPLVSGLRELRDYGKFLASNSLVFYPDGTGMQDEALPLYASFSTHGIHKSQKVNGGYFKDIHQTPSFGYYLCYSTDGLLEHWVRRMLILEEADKNPVERKIVRSALECMFGPEGCNVMTGLDVRVNYKDIVCMFHDGREIPVSILSDGYRRLFSIVIDIAFRCALLNGVKYGVDAARFTKGTVIIDEIDLHLHPSLQASVLRALQKTFPSLQFLISTHAPMVMSGVEADAGNSVTYMDYRNEGIGEYTVSRVDTYGMDISTLSETVLNVPSRDPSVKKELDELSNLIDEEDYDRAKALLSSLKGRFGDRIPELNGYDTQITIEESLR